MNRSMQSSSKGINLERRRRSPETLAHEKPSPYHLRKQRERLLKLREEVTKEVYQLRIEACEEVPNYSMHMADAATDSFDRDLVLGLATFEQEGLYEIDAALKRIEDGTYGFCELTGKPISWRRLAALPWTRFCLEAENQLEGHISPHLGRLHYIRPSAEEDLEASSDSVVEEEPESNADLDLLLTACRTKGKTPAGNEDRQLGDE